VDPRPNLALLAALCAGAVIATAALAATPGAKPAATPTPVHPALWPVAHSQGLVDAATEARIDAILARLSLEEKVGQVLQADISTISPGDLRRWPLGSILAGGNSGPNGNDRSSAADWLALVRAFHAVALEQRPGHEPIPLIFGIDAIHGHSNIPGVALYPHNIGLGAAHDPDLVRRIGKATAEEVAATGIDWAFAPTVAVPQDLRWGRTYEGYSQDPAQVRQYARAMTEGLQGPAALADKLQNGHVAASAKHFLGDGGTFAGVDEGDTRTSEATLIATHAQGYVSSIDAGVLTVMASYSSWNGTKMHGNKALLTDVLKGRMGFEGLVVGDYNGHGQVPGCSNAHCAAAFNAGVDLFMVPDDWKALFANTIDDVKSGAITMARLDDAVRRNLRVKFRLGMFEAARPFEGRLELLKDPAHRALAREAVRKSLVLIKNDGVLPLRANMRVLVAGDGANSLGMQSGGWSVTWQGNDTTNADYPGATSALAAIREAVASAGGQVLTDEELKGPVRPDVAVVVFGEQPYAEMQGDILIPAYNRADAMRLLERYKAAGIPTVSVLYSGRPLWVKPEVDASNAFVAAFLPGSEGGGIADVLVGDAAGKPRFGFTGRLSFAWPNGPVPPLGADLVGAKAAVSQRAGWPIGYGLDYGHAQAAH
jgi:beta-glucosidase